MAITLLSLFFRAITKAGAQKKHHWKELFPMKRMFPI